MRVALFGGSFDPPHVAHQMASLWAVSTGQVDRVLWAPCHGHPFGKDMAPYDDRLEMCRLAAADLLGAEVSTLDRDAQAEGRTLPALHRLIADRPGDEIVILIGADLLSERARWYGAGEIERLARSVVVGRGGFGGAPELPAVSSSAIRAALRRGEDVSALLPRAVLAYLRERGLYGTG